MVEQGACAPAFALHAGSQASDLEGIQGLLHLLHKASLQHCLPARHVSLEI